MRSLIISLIALITLSAQAAATPIVYDFTTPAYSTNFNADPAMFGTALSLAITVDNGSTSALNQAYSFSDIVSVTADAIGGTYAYTFTAADAATVVNDLLAPFLTTDGVGTPTLNLGNQDNKSAEWEAAVPSSYYSFGLAQVQSANGGAGNWADLEVTGPIPNGWAAAGINLSYYSPLSITGSLAVPSAPSPVPEPDSGVLFATGLTALVLFAWRRRSKIAA